MRGPLQGFSGGGLYLLTTTLPLEVQTEYAKVRQVSKNSNGKSYERLWTQQANGKIICTHLSTCMPDLHLRTARPADCLESGETTKNCVGVDTPVLWRMHCLHGRLQKHHSGRVNGKERWRRGGRRHDDRVIALWVSTKAMPWSPAREVGLEG